MDRIGATEAALAELAKLGEAHGPLILFQSGGCCDGSSPLCLHEGELLLGPGDVVLGRVGGVPFYVDDEQDERWNRPAYTLDVSSGTTDAFSLEAADGVHFVTRTAACGAPRPTGTGPRSS